MKKKKSFDIIAKGGVTSPKGFKASGICAGIKKSGKDDMALIYSEVPALFSGAFTSCLFEAAPVTLCKERLASNAKFRAVIINSGNANACTGTPGYKNAQKMSEITAAELSVAPENVLVSSTGRIGVQLPMPVIKHGIKLAAAALSEKGGDKAAKAIMTTDTRPKESAVSIKINGKKVTIGGMTKGAGMIAPKLNVPHATMLTYITTDADIGKPLLRALMSEGVNRSFNCVTIDGDTSTNDTVLLIANGSSGVSIKKGTKEAALFAEALYFVMEDLAKQIVYDGEGMTKFVTVTVNNAASAKDAELCARSVASSLLCKTAWFGSDPNWGRVLAAAGYSGATFKPEKFSLDYDEKPVVRNGQDAGTPEKALAKLMKRPEFTVKIDLNAGKHSHTIWTNDISYEYVEINADYHT